MNSDVKICIVSNVLNVELYNYSKSFFETMEYDKIIVSGKNKLYNFKFIDYVISNKQKFNFDWMVYIDEDCFITNKQALVDLINYQISNNYHCSGMPDGGVISHRFHNPIAINPFFMIMNLTEIRKKYNLNQIRESYYGIDLNKFIPTALIKKEYTDKPEYKTTIGSGYQPYGVCYDNFEPCYGFFFWLLRNNYNMLYLNADDYVDNITTELRNHENITFAYHTWFARNWNNLDNTKERILKVINYCNEIKI